MVANKTAHHGHMRAGRRPRRRARAGVRSPGNRLVRGYIDSRRVYISAEMAIVATAHRRVFGFLCVYGLHYRRFHL